MSEYQLTDELKQRPIYSPDYTDNRNAAQRFLKGVNTICNITKSTLGAKGKNIIFNKEDDSIHLTKDGATVARYVHANDPYEEMAIKVVREASVNTMKSSGDGTTSTLVLAQAIINQAYNHILNKQLDFYTFKKSADLALKDILNKISEYSFEIEKQQELLLSIGSVSANDDKIGKLIYDIIEQISIYGDIEVKQRRDLNKIDIEIVKGLRLWKGYYTAVLNNNKHKDVFEAEDPYILMYDGIIKNPNDIMVFIKYAMLKRRPLIIFVNDVMDVTLKVFENFKLNIPTADFMFVEHDGMGDNRRELQYDIMTLTGAQMLYSDINSSLWNEYSDDQLLNDPKINNLIDSYLGECDSAYITRSHCSLIGGQGDPAFIDARIDYLKSALKDSEISNYQTKFIKQRLGALSGGMAVINVGAQTEVEAKELKDRIDDAVLAVKSAIKEGAVIGGAWTWTKIYNDLSSSNTYKHDLGYKIVVDSLKSILSQLLVNADEKHKEQDIINQMNKPFNKSKAYNLIDGKFYNLTDYKIYDAASVLKDAVKNAISVSNSILSLEGGIFDGHVLM